MTEPEKSKETVTKTRKIVATWTDQTGNVISIKVEKVEPEVEKPLRKWVTDPRRARLL